MSKELDQRKLEAAALRWIARLPLLREDDFPLLTGAHETEARRALQALVRLGWIERVQVRSPEFGDHARYLLRAAAVPPFIEAFQLDEEEVRHGWPIGWNENLAHVTHVEITDFVNGLLAGIVANYGRTDAEVADARTLPHSRRDAESWCPQHVEGYGSLRYRDRFAHFFVAWDREAAPIVHRRARVRAWYDAAEARNHWGEYSLPPILLVLPSRRLEAEWERAITTAAQRRDIDELHVIVTDAQHAFGEVSGTTWHQLGESGATTLSSGLRWSSTPPPVHVPQAAHYGLLARGVDVHAPTLHEWATRVLEREAAGPRDRSAALAVRLEAHHREMRELLARHPYLSSDEIAERLGLAPQLVQRVIRDLLQHRLIGGLEEPALTRR